MNEDLTAKEDGPKLPDVDEEIMALADEMVSAGYIMSDMNVTYWVSILHVRLSNPDTDTSASGIVFAGLYSSHERAMAATRGIVKDIYESNRGVFPHVEVDNMVVETYVDVIPKPDMHSSPVVTTERLNPEDDE